jgi:hypothetical protein
VRSVGLITHRAGGRSPGDLALADVLRDLIQDRVGKNTSAAHHPTMHSAPGAERQPMISITTS